MPWENSPHGLLKHLVNEGMNTRAETVDAYMQIIPPGSRSGKHRQLAEQAVYVLEGRGYDIHVDCDLAIAEGTYHWVPQDEANRFEWEAGDMRLHSAEHDQPALQRRSRTAGATRDHQPHLQVERLERSRTDRDGARVRPQRKADRRIDPQVSLRRHGALTAPSRSSFVRAVAATGAAVATAGPLAAQGLFPLRLASSSDDDVTPALYARASGLFKNAGLTVTIDPLSNGTAVAAAIAGGAIDIGKASLLSIINAHFRGVPFVIIAPSGIADMGGSYAGMLVLKDSPIQSPRDLSGKTVAVPALHDIQSLATQALIDKTGGDSKSVSFVEEPGTAIGVALDTNRIASGVVANPALAQLMATGRYRSIGKPIEEGFNRDMIAAWITMADWATKNAGVVQRFGQAIATATAYCNAHPDKTLDLIAAFSNIDRSTLATMTRAKYASSLNPALVQPLVDAAARYGAIPKSYNAAELFSPAAYGYVRP